MKSVRDILLEQYTTGEITVLDLIDMIVGCDKNKDVPPQPPPSSLRSTIVHEGFGINFNK